MIFNYIINILINIMRSSKFSKFKNERIPFMTSPAKAGKDK